MKAINVHRLHDLVHALWPEGALDEISDGDGADKGRQTGILTFFFRHVVSEYLRGIVEGLRAVSSARENMMQEIIRMDRSILCFQAKALEYSPFLLLCM